MSLTNEQQVALNEELTNDPLGRGYAGMTDDLARIDLNTAYRDYSQDITISEFEEIMRYSGKWDDYKLRAEDRATNPAMAELMDVFASRIVAVDLRGHPNRAAAEDEAFLSYWSNLLDACVTEGSLGSFAAEEAKKLSDTMIERSVELLGQTVTTQDVTEARAL